MVDLITENRVVYLTDTLCNCCSQNTPPTTFKFFSPFFCKLPRGWYLDCQ